MPHWDENGNEEWVCQKGAHVCTGESVWVEGLGNVCKACMEGEPVKNPAVVVSTAEERPMSLREHCRIESGLDGPALDRYINRYYGHG